ncbi:NUDIX hydrolase [Nocardiopsis baichengensis]|uniref:NUDIX hydrolase n=1 Tax=Nocardiopsis baichengensis TaxID=280240 RepID=UPI00034AF615|nr:NUDIX hydrolase [Nocardiopsis baichengensis]
MAFFIQQLLDKAGADLPARDEEALRQDGASLERDAHMLAWALAEIRQGRWDGRRRDPDDPGGDPGGDPGAAQRQHMEEALHAADRLVPRAEALRAWALHGLRTHHHRSHADIADMLGVPRSTAAARWRALERTPPELWDWARGTRPEPPACDLASAGAVVVDSGGAILAAERARPPVGLVPGAAGHVDEHGDAEQAARAELAEEVGVGPDGPGPRLISLDNPVGGWRANRCRRPVPAGRTPGHQWTVYRALVERADAVAAAEEVVSWRWVDAEEAQRLADRTVAWAKGAVTDAEFKTRPGWEPVWLRWLAEYGLVEAGGGDLARVEALAEQAPAGAA